MGQWHSVSGFIASGHQNTHYTTEMIICIIVFLDHSLNLPIVVKVIHVNCYCHFEISLLSNIQTFSFTVLKIYKKEQNSIIFAGE